MVMDSNCYIHPQPLASQRNQEPEDADQVIVQTDFGRGIIIRTRKSDGIREIRLGNVESSSPAFVRRREPNMRMLYTPKEYPSIAPCIGDDVICENGRGVLKEICGDKYTIELASWRLNGRSDATCHVTTAPKVVRKHTFSEMDSAEKVAMAKTLKAQASKYFSEKDYTGALNTYASAVDKVRNVQHDHTSINEVRADLVVVMITCSNNAATCCIQLSKWEEAAKFAKNALILLDALYGKRGMKIHTILNSEGIIDAKLFGEWRVKSYIIVARTCMEQDDIAAAITILKKAKGVGMPYIDELRASDSSSSKEEKASVRILTSQMKEIKRLIIDYSEKKKAAKKIEKKKAQVMAKALFGSDAGKENTAAQEEVTHECNGSSETKESEQQIEKETYGGSTTTKRAPLLRKSSLKSHREGSSGQQSVSFSAEPPEVKEFDRINDTKVEEPEDDETLWQQHKEAFILIGVAGFTILSMIGLRRAYR